MSHFFKTNTRWLGTAAAIFALSTAALADEAPAQFSAASSLSPSGALSGLTLGAGESGRNRFSNFRFDIHFDFAWYGALGGGARIEFPLAPQGILADVDDEIALSFGAELFYFYNPDSLGLGVYPIVALQWNFFVSDRVSLFPELGVAFLFGPNRDRYWAAFIAPYLGFGVRFHFSDRNALLLRASWPAGLQVGLTF